MNGELSELNNNDDEIDVQIVTLNLLKDILDDRFTIITNK